jgi:RNA polymerase sigma-70 factor (ECF subfamily)
MDAERNLNLEIDLIERIAQGNRDAFAELYDRFSPALFSIALRILNDRAAAEDVLQEVFLLIWQRPRMYDPLRGRLDFLNG